ncbi:DEAD/DEAH box helicase [Undibacterium sp. Ji42W]|uniref:DEAD/DEAH box helicase n=1 Tax=Undibacterium sp. Ji42W TaxID=3413039 RepID=UPI003BF1DD99
MNTENIVSPTTQDDCITVLTTLDRSNCTVKQFMLNDEGNLTCAPYGQESYFYSNKVRVKDIATLANEVHRLSTQKNAMIIRGSPQKVTGKPMRRTSENFPEPESGCSWLMIDFDNLPLPEGMSPLGLEAINHCISKLPAEFHNVSYFYQFSASAGILKPDGTPLKTGLNVHLFFWLNRKETGKKLADYLILHCIETGFYEKTFDRSEAPFIRWGVDPAVLRSSVQPHYVGLPVLGPSVRCNLPREFRQGQVRTSRNEVSLPEFSPDMGKIAASERKRVQDAYRRECGMVQTRSVTRAQHGGISVSSYYTNRSGASPSTNRIFTEAKPYNQDESSVILHFDDEGSPGSWFVAKSSPLVARRFGDGSTLSLKELSDGAYIYVKDVLKWFTEVTQHDNLPLTESGYLPDISSFAFGRNVLIEAPTGSGKTTAFCRFALQNKGKVILYAAQTIALVKQMHDDLREQGLRTIHYKDFSRGDSLQPAVYVTTNESLSKLVNAAIERGVNFILVIDEAHMALDDFMVTEHKNALMEKAISRAERTLFMTATITPLQVTKLLDSVSRACGALTPEVYAGYRFMPAKENPLVVKPVGEFGGDIVALLRHMANLKERNTPLPRFVLIAPKNKMKVFRLLLAHFGLLDDAEVVSRQEATPEEVERARVSKKPILISSPMFALGLNFENQPAHFWTYFTYLQVDTSQIIQTLNRANRGNTPCEVRLYYGALDSSPIQIPAQIETRMKVEGYLADESSIQGVLDAHFHIDRPTYNCLRQAEKQTGKAMASLINGDQFQNYKVATNWQETLYASKEDLKFFKQLNMDARNSYLDDVEEKAEDLRNESEATLLLKLDQLHREKSVVDMMQNGRTAGDILADEQAVLMCLCDLDDPSLTTFIKPMRIRRLFGELKPYATAQFSQERTVLWRDVAAEKTEALVPLLSVLKRMRAGECDGNEFASLMRRTNLRRGVLALADSEANLLQVWNRKLDELDKLMEQSRQHCSTEQRIKNKNKSFLIAKQFLETIGVFFEKTVVDGKEVIDPTKPIVPNWDFEGMALVLRRCAESWRRMPTVPINLYEVAAEWSDADVSAEKCKHCVHAKPQWGCALGRPVEWPYGDVRSATINCDEYKPISASLRRATEAAEFDIFVGLRNATLPASTCSLS